MATERTQLRSMLRQLKRVTRTPGHILIDKQSKVRHIGDTELDRLIWACRNIRELKRSDLWTVLKESFIDPEMWEKPDRISGPIAMPRNRRGWGGGTSPGYGGTLKGTQRRVLAIDIRRHRIRIFSQRAYPPIPAPAMHTLIKTILQMWIMRGQK